MSTSATSCSRTPCGSGAKSTRTSSEAPRWTSRPRRSSPTEARMCVDNDSYPPIPQISGGSDGGKDFRLTSSDGTKFMAYAARAARPTGAGMIVIPDVRGLHIYYKELADRFAEVGVDAVAIDFFARTAPNDDRSDAFQFMEHVGMTKPDTIQADIAACAAH